MRPVCKTLLLVGMMSSTAKAACADEFGCTVMHCLSNPAGWASVKECVAPVQKLLNVLRGRGAFFCDTGSSSFGGVVVSQGKKPADRWIQWTDASGHAIQVPGDLS